MFKVECFVDDKDVGGVLRALAGFRAKEVTALPVVNAMPAKNGKVKPETANGTAAELVAERLQKLSKGSEVSVDNIRVMLKNMGRAPSSANYTIGELVKAKVLKKTGKPGIYEVAK